MRYRAERLDWTRQIGGRTRWASTAASGGENAFWGATRADRATAVLIEAQAAVSAVNVGRAGGQGRDSSPRWSDRRGARVAAPAVWTDGSTATRACDWAGRVNGVGDGGQTERAITTGDDCCGTYTRRGAPFQRKWWSTAHCTLLHGRSLLRTGGSSLSPCTSAWSQNTGSTTAGLAVPVGACHDRGGG